MNYLKPTKVLNNYLKKIEKFKYIRENHPKTALVIVDMIIRFLGFYLRKTTDRVYGIFLEEMPG